MLKNNDKILLLIGIVGALLFFWGYPEQNPQSAIKLPLKSEQIVHKTRRYLHINGYNVASLISKAQLKQDDGLIDSLNSTFGRPAVTKLLKHNGLAKLPAYYWQIDWYNKKYLNDSNLQIMTNSDNNSKNLNLSPEGTLYNLKVTLDGNIWEFNQPKEKKHPKKLVNRRALEFALKDTLKTDFRRHSNHEYGLRNFDDSTIISHLYFRFYNYSNLTNEEPPSDSLQISLDQFRNSLQQKQNIAIDRTTTAKMARFYLRFTPWHDINFKVDTVYSVPGTDGIVARVRFSNTGTIHQQKIHPEIDLTASGGLVGLNTKFNTSDQRPVNWDEIIGHLVGIGVYILLFLIFTIVFIRRIDARLFDSRAAILMGVLGWFLATGNILMDALNPFPSLHEFTTFVFYLKILIVPVIFGLLGAFAMFFGSGTTESIVRNVLPSKIETLNLARRGYFHNKDMGIVFLRSVVWAFILSGVLTIVLFFFPHTYLHSTEAGKIFLSDKSFMPIISIISKNLYFGLLTGFFVLLGLASYAYEFKSSAWSIIGVTVIFSALLSIIPINPFYNTGWILGAVIGLVLGFMYWRYDFLTTVLSAVFFFMLWETSTGWVIPHSPDLVTSLICWIILGVILILGFWGIYSNKSGEDIPEYIPRYVEEITQKQRMERELEIARSVQSTFLPKKFPKAKGVEIAADCHSALEVGGDYYDIIDLDDGRLGIAIADVSGKGIQAAFYMTLLKGFLQSLCHQIDSPARLLSQINKLFYRNAERGTFISMIYGILDTKQKTFTFARAGHNPLVLKSSTNSKAESLKPDGLALGMTSDGLFDEYIKDVTINLSAGNLITLYTDGYTEAMNNKNELFGEQNLITSLERLSKQHSKTILDETTRAVNQFVNGARQHDDMTMIVIKVN